MLRRVVTGCQEPALTLAASVWLDKPNRHRRQARVAWTVSARSATDDVQDIAAIAHAQAFTDDLRPHRLVGTVAWDLPDAPHTTRIRLNGEWGSAVPGFSARWADPRLSLGAVVELDIMLPTGWLSLTAGVRHGVAVPLGALTTDVGPTLQWSRLSERLQDTTQVQLGVTFRH